MPVGSVLRFRYQLTDLIPESLKPLLEKNNLVGEEICLAYLDRNDPLSIPAKMTVHSG